MLIERREQMSTHVVFVRFVVVIPFVISIHVCVLFLYYASLSIQGDIIPPSKYFLRRRVVERRSANLYRFETRDKIIRNKLKFKEDFWNLKFLLFFSLLHM